MVNINTTDGQHNKDKNNRPLMVRLPPNGKPGDTIIFEVPTDVAAADSNSSCNVKVADDKVEQQQQPLIITARLERQRWWENIVKYSCFCCIWCFPDGVVEVSEMTFAFIAGLWIGLVFIFGFAMGTLYLLKEVEENPKL